MARDVRFPRKNLLFPVYYMFILSNCPLNTYCVRRPGLLSTLVIEAPHSVERCITGQSVETIDWVFNPKLDT